MSLLRKDYPQKQYCLQIIIPDKVWQPIQENLSPAEAVQAFLIMGSSLLKGASFLILARVQSSSPIRWLPAEE